MYSSIFFRSASLIFRNTETKRIPLLHTRDKGIRFFNHSTKIFQGEQKSISEAIRDTITGGKSASNYGQLLVGIAAISGSGAYLKRESIIEFFGLSEGYNTGLVQLQPLYSRKHEDYAKMFKEVKKDLLCFARTADFAFSKKIQDGEMKGHPNPVRKVFEELMAKGGIEINIVLMSDKALEKLNDEDLKNTNTKILREKTLKTIDKLNRKYPKNKIKVILSDEPLFVFGNLIDRDLDTAKVCYTRGHSRYKIPLLYTFVKNKGGGLGYAETAEPMIETWEKLAKQHIDETGKNEGETSSILMKMMR